VKGPPGRARRWLLALGAAALLFLLYGTLIEPAWIEVTRHEAEFEHLPPEFDGLVLAHLSDLHLHRYGGRERHALALLGQAKPDLIAITGDFDLEDEERGPVRQFLLGLRALKPTFGIWAVLGTHDHRNSDDAEAARTFLTTAGVALLVNEWGRIGKGFDTLSVVGLDDAYTGRDDLDKALDGLRRTPFALLLTHSPEVFFRADLARFDLVLAGHTHGGQVRLPWIGALWLPHGSEFYDAGWFSGQSAKMYVTRGIGTSKLPIRFLCRPEIALITLKRVAQPN
jgi:predicted MPP superfamily phosphohydrolase